MKKKISERFYKWIRKKPDDTETFNLLFLLLIGKWFLPTMMLWIIPLSLGTNGIEISPQQNQQIANNLTQSYTENLEKMNQLGLNMSGTLAGHVLNIFVMAIPYLTLMMAGIVLLCLFRQVLALFLVKK